MIKRLTVVTTNETISREGIPGVERFENATGILKTRRYPFDSQRFLHEAMTHVQLIDKKKIGGVILVTQSPYRLSPCMAADVHKYFELNFDIPVMDLGQSCDGFVYALALAARLPTRDIFSNILVVCMDQLRFAQTPTEGLIFSDCVAIAEVSQLKGFFPSFWTDSDGVDKLHCGMNGQMAMDGGEVFDFVTQFVPPLIEKAKRNKGISEYDFLCLHQANLAMMRIVAKKTGFEGRSLECIQEYGNMSLVSIPMALAYNEEKILGKDVLLVGYGAGFCAAAGGIQWSKEKVSRIVEI